MDGRAVQWTGLAVPLDGLGRRLWTGESTMSDVSFQKLEALIGRSGRRVDGFGRPVGRSRPSKWIGESTMFGVFLFINLKR